MSTNWTDEQKDEMVAKYLDSDPTPENSMEIVKEIAEEFGTSPNGVRMILSKKNVYIKKDGTKSTSSTAASGDKPARVSKEAAHARLVSAITDAGQSADSEIISKLTGKAALHFAEVIEAITK